MRHAVALDGYALQFASPELRADLAVVRLAVAQSGLALGFASAGLRADRPWCASRWHRAVWR